MYWRSASARSSTVAGGPPPAAELPRRARGRRPKTESAHWSEAASRSARLLLAVPHALGDLSFALDRLRDHAPTPYLRFAAAGPEPGPRELEELREAGVEFALWKPFDDAALRFVLNEALQDPHSGESRNVLRAPTAMLARVFSAAGQKAALVYNLSERGAFLETLRPTSAKGHVRVELPLPTGTVTLAARVVTTNVPGNIQKPNLPMGMGVEFTDVPEETRHALAEHVEAMAERYRIDKPDLASLSASQRGLHW